MSERMPAQDFVRVGTITRPHGLRGEVNVALCTAAPENMLAYRRVFLSAAEDRGSAEKREFQVLQARLADKGLNRSSSSASPLSTLFSSLAMAPSR